MNLYGCLNPVKVIHPYTKELLFVPCGKCDACKNARSASWTMRIVQESKSHRYAYTFETDYRESDIPKLRVHENCLENVRDGIVIPFVELFEQGFETADYRFLARRKYIPYNSKSEAQRFLKRLRQNLRRKYGLSDHEAKFRYYCVGEYGGTTFRPHIHWFLWFDSERFKDVLREVLCESWACGRVRALKPEHEGSAPYVANYFTCDTHLPAIYRWAQVKQFMLCSRRPALGSLPLYSPEVKALFDSPAPCSYYKKSGIFTDYPLSSLYKNRLFPVLPFLDKANSCERNTVYQFPLKFDSFTEFKAAVYENAVSNRGDNDESLFYFDGLPCDWNKVYYQEPVEVPRSLFSKDTFLSRYCAAIYGHSYRHQLNSHKYDDLHPDDWPWHLLRHWWSVSHHVNSMCGVYDVSMSRYVSKIFKFVSTDDYLKLRKQLEFEEEYSKYNRAAYLLNIDYSYLYRLKNSPVIEFTNSDWMLLESFGLMQQDFDVPFVRSRYLRRIKNRSSLPKSELDTLVRSMWLNDVTDNKNKLLSDLEFYNLPDFEFFSSLEKYKREKNTKTKINRDFLLSKLNDPRYKWAIEYHNIKNKLQEYVESKSNGEPEKSVALTFEE